MSSPQFVPPMTVADFLDWPGDGSGAKFELVNGEPRAMSRGSATHAIIQSRRMIGNHLEAKRSECYVGTEPGVVPRIRADANLRFPDLGVSRTPNEPGQKSFPDPILLIEVLSPSKSDTWNNVWAYCTIPTVREILIVHSTRVRAQLLRRDAEGAWPPEPEDIAGDAELRLDSIGLACPLREAYSGTYLVR